MKFML